MAIRVVLADDNDVVLAAEVEVLRHDGRFEVVDTVGDANRAVEAVARHRPDLVILDLRMSGGGLSAARAIHAAGTGAAVAVLTAGIDAAHVADLLRVGVRAVLLKGHVAHTLPNVLARCCAGEVLLLVPCAAAAIARLTAPT